MQISKLEKKVSEEEDKRIMKKIEKFSKKEKNSYHEGYADAMIYLNKLTREVFEYGKQ